MSDARKRNPKPGQHLGKRVRNPKKTPKAGAANRPAPSRAPYPMADWERELLGYAPGKPRRRRS